MFSGFVVLWVCGYHQIGTDFTEMFDGLWFSLFPFSCIFHYISRISMIRNTLDAFVNIAISH